ncbi:7703_t:CDS:2 [Entrophospora sp. SA101]|nr:7703_t:CDS:2 [Entrophospora sp. SA101]
MDVTCLRSLALNILKNGYPESIASSIEIPELEPCSICNEELFLHQLKKSFTVLTCGHIFHRLCLENNRENTTILIQCYYNFGELLSQRFYFHYSQVKNDQMAQVEVNKEAREQLPSNISGDAFKKRTERARKVYFLFSQEHIGKEKIGLVKSFTALTISKLSLGDIKYIINKTKPS